MEAAVLQGTKQMEVLEWQNAAPSGSEVIVKVKSCGICGTDQHIYHGHPGSAEVQPPIVLGHELAGEVVEVGAEVTHLQKGDRVSIDPNIYCGICEYCRSNRAHLCSQLQAVGVTRDGGMGEYCTVPAANCYKIPEEMTYEEAALVEPLGCVLHGFKKISLTPLSKVLIIGGGVMNQKQVFTSIYKYLPEFLHDYVALPELTDYIVSPGLGDAAGITGSLLLAQQAYQEEV